MYAPTETPLEVPHQIEFRGITCKIWADFCDSTERDLIDYVDGHIARANGDRLSDKGLVVHFLPSGFEGHDTSIASGLTVGKDVVVGLHVSIGKELHAGKNVRIGDGSTIGQSVKIDDFTVIGESVLLDDGTKIGKHASVGSGARIGKDNFIPDLAEVDGGVEIPDGLLNSNNVRVTTHYITQKFVDSLVRQQTSVFGR